MPQIKNRQTTKPVTRKKTATGKTKPNKQASKKQSTTNKGKAPFDFKTKVRTQPSLSLAAHGFSGDHLDAKSAAIQVTTAFHEAIHFVEAALDGKKPFAHVSRRPKGKVYAGGVSDNGWLSIEAEMNSHLMAHAFEMFVLPKATASQAHLNDAIKAHTEHNQDCLDYRDRRPLPDIDVLIDKAKQRLFLYWPLIWAVAVEFLENRDSASTRSIVFRDRVYLINQESRDRTIDFIHQLEKEIKGDQLDAKNAATREFLKNYYDAPKFYDTIVWLRRANDTHEYSTHKTFHQGLRPIYDLIEEDLGIDPERGEKLANLFTTSETIKTTKRILEEMAKLEVRQLETAKEEFEKYVRSSAQIPFAKLANNPVKPARSDAETTIAAQTRMFYNEPLEELYKDLYDESIPHPTDPYGVCRDVCPSTGRDKSFVDVMNTDPKLVEERRSQLKELRDERKAERERCYKN